MSDSTGTRKMPVLNEMGDVDQEWVAAFEKEQDYTLIFCALIVMEAMLVHSGYSKEQRESMKIRIRALAKVYDLREPPKERKKEETSSEGRFSSLFR